MRSSTTLLIQVKLERLEDFHLLRDPFIMQPPKMRAKVLFVIMADGRKAITKLWIMEARITGNDIEDRQAFLASTYWEIEVGFSSAGPVDYQNISDVTVEDPEKFLQWLSPGNSFREFVRDDRAITFDFAKT